jgi:DNA recombination-dependent growth factor C
MNKKEKVAPIGELSKPESEWCEPFERLSNVAMLSLCHFILIDVESEYDLRFASALHAEADARKLRAEQNPARKWNPRKFTRREKQSIRDHITGPVTPQDELKRNFSRLPRPPIGGPR